MLGILAKSLRTGILTEADPFGKVAPFGFPVIDFTRCTACRACASACPTGAIQATGQDASVQPLSLSHAACIRCGACVTVCGEQAVRLSANAEIAAYTRRQLAQAASFAVDPVSGCCTFRAIELRPGLGLAESAARLRDRIRGR